MLIALEMEWTEEALTNQKAGRPVISDDILQIIVNKQMHTN